ncbi:MAG: hypothetical protein HUU48_10125 [Flavobacteriales bacterium]|nr:hypothetical protein [Flavobacteriales bacterium]
MKKFLFAAVSVVLFTACANHYKYFGRTYAPTSDAQLYFRETDISEPFEVMGKMDVTVPEKMKTEKIQRKVQSTAAKKGADAIIVDNFDMQAGSFITTGGNISRESEDGRTKGEGGKSKTKIKKDIVVKASLVKFKKNIPTN